MADFFGIKRNKELKEITADSIGALSSDNGAVKTANINDEAITTDKYAPKSISAAKIVDKTIGAGQLADNIPYTKFGLTAEQVRRITFGTGEPSGGNDGDVYIQYT